MTLNAIRLNGECRRWFKTTNGSKQGDSQSPTHFSIYVNGLIEELNKSKIGIKLLDKTITVLAYADDLVLLAPIQAGLQQLISIVDQWCHKWRLKVNCDKTKIMHVRPKTVQRTQYQYAYGTSTLEKVSHYKYLGFILNEFGTMDTGSNSLASAGERALGALISKVKMNGDIGYRTFEQLYISCVTPVLDYCGRIWGISNSRQNQHKRI